MNNNQDIFNTDPQMNNINTQNTVPTLNRDDIGMESTKPLNVIPQSMPINNQDDTAHRFDQEFIKTAFGSNPQPVAPVTPTQNTFINPSVDNSINEPVNPNMVNNLNNNNIIDTTMNTSVNNNPINNSVNAPIANPNSNVTEPPIINNVEEELPTSNENTNKFINNNRENINTSLNNLNIDGNYNNMPKVDYSQEPQVQENLKKKNTITITSEGKVFIIIIIVLLLFTFIMPYIFDMFRNLS